MKTIVTRAISAAAGLVLLSACGGGEWPPVGELPTAVETEEPAATTPEAERPDVPPLECFTLLTDDEIEEALGESGLYGHGQGEVCTKQLADDERFFVRTEPGAPGDLEPGAELLGVPGEPVSAVGDEARWFGGTGAEGGGTSGILSVHQSTSLGELYFRIALGRPDVDSAEQRDIAKELALRALPRFPGVEQPEPEPLTFEPEQVDRSNAGFVDNLLAKEAAGEWTRGEGLVATLGLFAGEVETDEVLPQPDLLDSSGTGVIRMAREYLEDGPDAEARAEIARLLNLLVPSREQMEATAGEGPPMAAPAFHALSLGAAQAQEDCIYWFGTNVCASDAVFPELDKLFGKGKYSGIVPEKPTHGWTDDHILWAMQAVKDSAKKYEAMGKMPKVFFVLTPWDAPRALTDTELETCLVHLNTPMQFFNFNKYEFMQVTAIEMAHCMISETFPAQASLGYEVTRWWQDGLALWLSAVVYPATNLEQTARAGGAWIPQSLLTAYELDNTLLDRTLENWLFFAHAQDLVGWESGGIRDLIRGLPPPPPRSGRAAQEDALAGYDGIDGLLLTFAEGLTDESIPDPGSGARTVPYEAPAYETPISGRTMLWAEPQRFGEVRLHLVVDPGKYACVEYKEQGELRSSWRTGEPGAPGGSWSEDLPDSLDGEAVFVVTTTEKGALLEIDVTDVDDDPECEDEEDGGSAAHPCPLDYCEPSDFYWSTTIP
jgi:hypothetical protein